MLRSVLLGLPIAVSGCVSVLPEPVVPEGLYRLYEAPDQSVTRINLPKNLLVREPEGSGLLLGKSIVTEDSSGALALMRSAQWSDPASRMLEALLIDKLTLASSGADGRVITGEDSILADYHLSWRVRDFVLADDEARIAFQVTLTDVRRRTVLRQFNIIEREALNGASSQEAVGSLIDVARRAIDRTVAEVGEAFSS